MIIKLQGHICKITDKTVTKFGSRNKYALPKVIIGALLTRNVQTFYFQHILQP